MVFSRFFKDKGAPAPSDPEPEDEAPNADDATDDADESGTPEEWSETTWAERAASVLPTGTSTGSKRPDALYGDADIDDPYGPTHYTRATGCHIETSDGTTLVDCTMALGSVAIGYADPEVTRAALEAAGGGNVAGLPSVLEVDVAERFCELVPCAEKVQFLKTGAEAVAAAVRLARAYTSRDLVIGCGYFGWLDWSSTAPGVPASTQQHYKTVPFDDVAALTQAAADAGNTLAAIVIEPVVERMPSREWIELARALCDKLGAVLIFDEIKTGFRLAPGGYQDFADIKPDLATFGKALANGFPLSAVCGRADLMDVAKRTWISSTLATESSALAAAYVVLEMHREGGVCENLAKAGKEIRRVVGLAITSSGVKGVAMGGIDPMWLLAFDSKEAEARFLRSAVRHDVLFKRGAYNYASLAHDDDAILAIEAAASNAFVEVRRAMDGA
jgi:glutamate-1-semialdehyde 2,1-aminomutase